MRGIRTCSDLVGEEPYVVVHPGASAPARAWPPLHHAAAVELLEGAGHRVVVTGGPDETNLTATVAGPSALDLGGRTDLKTLAGVLARAGVLVTGNTGPGASGGRPRHAGSVPVLAGGSGDPLGTVRRPAGDPGRPGCALQAQPCHRVPGPRPSLPGLGVAPEQLLEAVERLIGGVSSLSTRRKVAAPMRVLLWHVHGGWTDAFVRGPHEYLLPVLPEGGAWGLGRAGRDWPDSVRDVALGALDPDSVDAVVLQRPEEIAEVARALGRSPGRTSPPCTWNTTRPRATFRTRCIRWPTSTPSRWSTSRTSTS